MNENHTNLGSLNSQTSLSKSGKNKNLEPPKESKLDETIKQIKELKKSFFGIRGIDIILSAVSAGLIVFNVVLGYDEYLKLSLSQIFIGGYLLFFGSIVIFTKVTPVGVYCSNFKFMEVKYGPAAFLLFVGKLKH